jgi:hypothetical protein
MNGWMKERENEGVNRIGNKEVRGEGRNRIRKE